MTCLFFFFFFCSWLPVQFSLYIDKCSIEQTCPKSCCFFFSFLFHIPVNQFQTSAPILDMPLKVNSLKINPKILMNLKTYELNWTYRLSIFPIRCATKGIGLVIKVFHLNHRSFYWFQYFVFVFCFFQYNQYRDSRG